MKIIVLLAVSLYLFPHFTEASPHQLSDNYGALPLSFTMNCEQLNATGVAFIYSTYIRGTADDCLNAIAIDSTNNVYVTGWLTSTDYPVTHRETLTGGSPS